MSNISIIGSGTWGSAVGEQLVNKGFSVKLWQRDKAKAEHIQSSRIHPLIPDHIFSKDIEFSWDFQQVLIEYTFLGVAVPSHCVRDVLRSAKDHIKNDSIIINLSKGLEESSLLTMSQVISEELDSKNVKVVSVYGPSHAEEVIRNIPTTLVAASNDEDAAKDVQSLLSSNVLRVYTNSDILGVEIGGSVKNVIAIAAGISDGIGFGDNTKAAIFTRGIAEMTRLGVAMGANESTFSGLSGIGDLFVTCSSEHSRNRNFGEKLGKGQTSGEVLSKMEMVAEGVITAKVLNELCRKLDIEMPISSSVYKVIYENKDPADAVSDLMTRDLTTE